MLQISRIIMLICLTVLSVLDIRSRRIPVKFMAVFFLTAIMNTVLLRETGGRMIAAGAAVGLLFPGISRITGEQMGYADSIAILALGIYLGLLNLVSVLMIAFVSAAILAVAITAKGGMKRKAVIPFFPFLTAGYIVMLFVEGGLV